MNIFRSKPSGQEEAIEKQHQQRLHSQNLADATDSFDSNDREYLRELTQHDLDEHSLALMENMFSQDFVLSNLKDAEVTEIKWLARIIAMKIKRMHPPPESVVSGESRKVFFDDTGDGLSPLSPHQENLIDQAVLEFLTRPTRSRDGWQQDEISKQVRVSRTEEDDDDDERGSLFR